MYCKWQLVNLVLVTTVIISRHIFTISSYQVCFFHKVHYNLFQKHFMNPSAQFVRLCSDTPLTSDSTYGKCNLLPYVLSLKFLLEGQSKL